MRYFLYFPLLAILLIVYNLLMVTGDIVEENPVAFQLPLMSTTEYLDILVGDLFVMVGILLLYFELLKAARVARLTVLDHALSLVVFIIFLIELIVVEGAGTATFLNLTLMALLDVVAGFTITISTARRDFSVGGALDDGA